MHGAGGGAVHRIRENAEVEEHTEAGPPHGRRALVVGGTGMLASAVRVLAVEGYQVFLPSRGPRPELPGEWIAADWSDPAAFARAVTRATGDGPVDLFVLWAHRPHRSAVAPLLRPVVGPDTVVVEVAGSAQYRETGERREYAQSRLVVLGSRDGRWLTHAEISDGVLAARQAPPGTVRYVGAVPGAPADALPGTLPGASPGALREVPRGAGSTPG